VRLRDDSRSNLLVAARALMAYRRGESTPQAVTGALLEAEFFANVHALIRGLSRGK
jgi:hypothetical protein